LAVQVPKPVSEASAELKAIEAASLESATVNCQPKAPSMP
jgi:hypothetical protein